ncbi:MAG: MtrB/PioB family decaheme-associated outer membrane protein [Vicinamibacterales bacterium]
MRKTYLILTATLLAATAGLASAQQDVLPGKPLGTLDVGFRASSVEGDRGRFERYQDVRSAGAGLNLSLNREGPSWAVDLGAKNVGYRDQQFNFAYTTNKLLATFEWNQVPLYYTSVARTPYKVGSDGVLTLDSAARLAVQNRQATGIPTNAAALGNASIYRSLAQPFDLRSRRDAADFRMKYAATSEVDVTFGLTSYRRTGYQPWGAAFAFNNAQELPLPLDNRTTDFSAAVEWAGPKGMLRVGYDGSYFDNSIQTLTWDNPLRATDYNLNATTVTGYDPSGYSNGNGPASGRMSLAPSNHANTVSALGMIKLPRRTTLMANLGFTGMKQNEALIGWTSNPVIANPAVYALFPHLAHLERETAEADVRVLNANFAFNSRPNRYFSLRANYRYNDHNNRTPHFDATEYVRFDAVPEETGSETEPFSIKRQTFNVDATFTPIPYTAFRVGYGHEGVDRTYRLFEKTGENTFRASVDVIGNAYVSIRGLYEHARREGSGFNEHALTAAGQQPEMRQFDVANRTRNRGTVFFDLTPLPVVTFTASVAAGKDDYPDQEFGLLNNDNTAYTVGVQFYPRQEVGFGVTFGRENYASVQESRNANPAPDPSWTDPNRNWAIDIDEKVNTVGLNLDLLRALPKTEIRVGYEYSDSDQGFVHNGPRIVALAALNQFEALPDVTNTWHRATADLRYFVNPRVGIGVTYWYDRFDVNDYATISLPDGSPRIDYLGGLTTGYGFRPYKANTGSIRVFYLF